MNDKWLYSYLYGGDDPQDIEFSNVDTDWDKVDEFVMDQIELGGLDKFTGVSDKVGLKESMENQERNELIGYYSDLYKEIYNVRPRGINFDSVSLEDLKIGIEDLHQEQERMIESEKEWYEKSVVKFNDAVQKVIESGAGDRQTALRWMFKDLNSPNYDDYYGYADNDLKYRIKDELRYSYGLGSDYQSVSGTVDKIVKEIYDALLSESGAIDEQESDWVPADQYDELTDTMTTRHESTIGASARDNKTRNNEMKRINEGKTIAAPGQHPISESELIESEKYNCFESLLPEGFGFKDEEWGVMTESEKETFVKYHLAEDVVEEVAGDIITESDIFEAELEELESEEDEKDDIVMQDEEEASPDSDDSDVEDVFERLIKGCGYHEDEWNDYL